MKINSVNIINFGKFHDTQINFNQNLNTFLHENGWGKTTLSVFIKSMFYGMEHTTKKDLTENEKKKYMPWQGGTYGGSLTFEHNGKEYRITRTFSTKKNEDTFELLDLKTNKPSTDYTSDLGTELFGIGKDTYARSVHVTLDQTPAGSNDISARLNNLVEADDISNFDNAISVLDKTATSIKAKRGSAGELFSIQQDIENKRSALEDIDSRIIQNAECEKRILTVQQTIDALKKQQEEITVQLSDCAKYESKIRYAQLNTDVAEAQKSIDTISSFFNGNIPSGETVKNIDELTQSLATVESNIKTQSATQSQKNDYEQLKLYFAGDIPTQEQITQCLEADNQYKSFQQKAASLMLTQTEQNQLETLRLKYSDGNISGQIIQDYMADIETVQNNKNLLAQKNTALTNEQTRYQEQLNVKIKNTRRIILSITAALVFIAGAASFVLKILPAAIAAFSSGIVLLILAVLSKTKKPDLSQQEQLINSLRQEIESLTKEIISTENRYKLFTAKYSPGASSELMALTSISTEYENYTRLLKKSEEYTSWLNSQKKPEEYINTIKQFLLAYCRTQDISSVPSQIQILNGKLKKLEQLESLVNADSENTRILAEQKHKLDSVLNSYNTDRTRNYSEQVKQIHEQITTLKNSRDQLQEAKDRLEQFEQDPSNDIDSFKNLTKPEKSIEELQQHMTLLTDEINQENRKISDYRKTIENNLTYTEKKEDIETEIENLSIKKQEKTEENRILVRTIELLTKAKENLDANYSDPMKQGFNKYVSMLGSNLNLVINTDLEVSVDSQGILHERESLSEGYKDLVNFCSRMALIDALFKEAAPAVILDDPFVNLDDDKVPKALNLVNELSKDRQIIYFACHESRSIK